MIGMEPAEPSDPFEFFAEQEASWWAASKYRERLCGMARTIFTHTGEAAGGLVLCAGTRLGKLLAQATAPGQRPDPDRQDCVTAMPRPDFDGFVRVHAPKAYPSLPEVDPEWQRNGRVLPILIETKNGYRLICESFDLD